MGIDQGLEIDLNRSKGSRPIADHLQRVDLDLNFCLEEFVNPEQKPCCMNAAD